MKNSDTIITNERTIERRAWIDNALHSVRARLGFTPDATGSDPKGDSPNLYVAYPDRRVAYTDRRDGSTNRRRSGT